MTREWMLLFGAVAMVGCGEEGEGANEPLAGSGPFVSVEELAKSVDSVVLIDTRDPEAYAERHITGAINAPWQTFADVGNGEPGDPDWGTLLPPDEIAAALGALGVDTSKTVVTYADPAGWGEDGRVMWSLQSIGLTDLRMLDGGFPAWTGAGEATTEDVPELPATDVVATDRLDEINVTTEQVLAAVESGSHVIIDARTTAEYDGAQDYGEARGGHIPGAISVPFVETLAADGTVKSEDELRALYEDAGVDLGAPIYVYCTKGIRSAYEYQLLSLLGADAKNYDASFYSWAGDETLPLE